MEINKSAKFALDHRLLLLPLALTGIGFILLLTSRYGPGISPDSVGYIVDARELIASEPSELLYNLPSEFSPPLYPLLLGMVGFILGADPLFIAHFVNAVIFGLIVYTSGILAYRTLPLLPVILLLLICALIIARPLSSVMVMAWTEPLFILIVLLSLIFADSFLAKRNRSSLLLLSSAIALASLTRYIGIALILWGAIIILLFGKDDFGKKANELVVFMLITLSPIGLWLIRNHLVSGTLAGQRSSSILTLSQNFAATYKTLGAWYIPAQISENGSQLVAAGVTAALLISAGIWRARQRINLQNIILLLLFVLIYCTFLIISATTTAHDEIGDRLLSPIFIPATLLLFYAAWLVAGTLGGSTYSGSLVAVFATGFLLWSAYLGADIVSQSHQVGWGFNDRLWRKSETIKYVLQSPYLMRSCPLYSNLPAALYIRAGLHTGWVPQRTFYRSPEIANELDDVSSFWPKEDEGCLIWFEQDYHQTYLYNVEELQTVLNIRLIARLTDGSIYHVSKKQLSSQGMLTPPTRIRHLS